MGLKTEKVCTGQDSITYLTLIFNIKVTSCLYSTLSSRNTYAESMKFIWLKRQKKSASDKIKLLIWHGHGHIDHIFIRDRLSCPNAYTRKIWRVWVLRQKGSARTRLCLQTTERRHFEASLLPKLFSGGLTINNKQKYHTARTTPNLAPEFTSGF